MAVPVFDPRLFAMEGQSNNIGVGPIEDIQPDLVADIPGAKIFYGRGTNFSSYTWQQLKLNVNNEGTDGKTSPGYRGHFGCEMRIMKLLQSTFGGEFKLLKVGEGGTCLHQDSVKRDWSPLSRNEFFDISESYENAGIAALPEGLPPAFCLWIQGEDDIYPEAYGLSYVDNLTERIALKRQQFGWAEMPFVIVRLGNMQTSFTTEYKNLHDVVRGAQEYVASHVPKCYLVDFDDLPTSDGTHYTADAYDIGARRIFEVIKRFIPIQRRKMIHSFSAVSFAEAGITPENTSRVTRIGNPNISFKPERQINGINSFEAGRFYEAVMSEQPDLSSFTFTP